MIRLSLVLSAVLLLSAQELRAAPKTEAEVSMEISRVYEEAQNRLAAQAGRDVERKSRAHQFVLFGFAVVLLNMSASLLGLDPFKKRARR